MGMDSLARIINAMNTQRRHAVCPDTLPELDAFIQHCRRNMFWGELADRLLPALCLAATVLLVMLLARSFWLGRPLVALMLLMVSLAGLAMGMKRLPQLKHPNLITIIAVTLGLLAWLVLPPWALVGTVAGVCAGLVVLGTPIKSFSQAAWLVDAGNGANGVLLTAVDSFKTSAIDPVEDLFRHLVQQSALRLIPSITCPVPFNVRRNRMVAAATGAAALAIALVLLLGPPTARPWNVLSTMQVSGAGPQPTQPTTPGANPQASNFSPNKPQSSANSRRTNSQPRQPGNAGSRSGSTTGHHGSPSGAAAVQYELLRNSAYRKMAAGAAGMSAGGQASQDFARLTEREKRHLVATIRRAEKKVLHDPKLLSQLQKLAVAASGNSAAAFSTALKQTQHMLQTRLGPMVPGHTGPVRSGKPGIANSSGHGATGGTAGENSSSIAHHTPTTPGQPKTGLSSMTSGNVTVLHVLNARGSGNLAAVLENSTAVHRIRNVPEQYRYLIRRYFARGR